MSKWMIDPSYYLKDRYIPENFGGEIEVCPEPIEKGNLRVKHWKRLSVLTIEHNAVGGTLFRMGRARCIFNFCGHHLKFKKDKLLSHDESWIAKDYLFILKFNVKRWILKQVL